MTYGYGLDAYTENYKVSYLNGNILEFFNLTHSVFKFYEYDNKNSPFKNIIGFDKYLLGVQTVHNNNSNYYGHLSFENTLYTNTGGNNNLINILGDLDVNYSYNNKNYPVTATENWGNGASAETTIEYYE